jgi:hypothetical protein
VDKVEQVHLEIQDFKVLKVIQVLQVVLDLQVHKVAKEFKVLL